MKWLANARLGAKGNFALYFKFAYGQTISTCIYLA